MKLGLYTQDGDIWNNTPNGKFLYYSNGMAFSGFDDYGRPKYRFLEWDQLEPFIQQYQLLRMKEREELKEFKRMMEKAEDYDDWSWKAA